MASKKLTNANKNNLLTDWIQSPTNRGDTLYFVLTEINSSELKNTSFYKGMLISVTPVDEFMGKVTFIELLT